MKITSYNLDSYREQVTSCLALCLWLFAFNSLYGQKNLPLNRDYEFILNYREGKCIQVGRIDNADPVLIKLSCLDTIHSNFKPTILPDAINRDYKASHYSLIIKKLKKENLFIVNDTAD